MQQDSKDNMDDWICEKLAKLTFLHDYDFSSEKKKKAQKLGDEILKELKDKTGAFALYAKGNVNLMTNGDSSSSERMLSKALKLDPSIVDAWNALGTVFWKKGDLVQAKRCFEGGNEKRKNKVSQREMSMLIRDARMVKSQGKGNATELAKRRMDNIKESIALAKSAVSLDVKDGRSWYYVGNAYLSQFFDVSKSIEDLERALRAYHASEKCGEGERNPDLHYNRGNVLKFMERYEAAAKSYLRASEIDQTLPAESSLFNMKRRFLNVVSLVQKRGRTKPKHFKSIVSDLKSRREALIAHPSKKDVYCDVVNFEDLLSVSSSSTTTTTKKSNAVCVKCLHVARSGEEPPATLIVTDSNGMVLAVSIYNLSLDAVQYVALLLSRRLCLYFDIYTFFFLCKYRYASKCDVITLVDPVISETKWPDVGSYRSVQISNPRNFLVDGKCISSFRTGVAMPEMTTKTFDG